MCRDILPYDLASRPAKFNGISFSSFRLQIEYVLATNCSARIKDFVCALLEPECSPQGQPKMPCYNLCKAILDRCESYLPHVLAPAFNCLQYSSANCVGARMPCSRREMACGDGSCIPREWICDGTPDCPGSEDEAPCSVCAKNEFRCQSGACISRHWLDDGYADCPDGDDESETGHQATGSVPTTGHQAAGSVLTTGHQATGSLPTTGHHVAVSAPTTAVQPAKFVMRQNTYSKKGTERSKRLFTRQPYISRLRPYFLPTLQEHDKTKREEVEEKAPKKKIDNPETTEDVNVDDLGLFGVTAAKNGEKERTTKSQTTAQSNLGRASLPKSGQRTRDGREGDKGPEKTKLDKTNNKFDLMQLLVKKAMQLPEEEYQDLIENTIFENEETPMDNIHN